MLECHTKVSAQATKAKIWSQVNLDLRSEWKRRQEQVGRGSIIVEDALYFFQFDFGQNDWVYTIRENKLEVARIPPTRLGLLF